MSRSKYYVIFSYDKDYSSFETHDELLRDLLIDSMTYRMRSLGYEEASVSKKKIGENHFRWTIKCKQKHS